MSIERWIPSESNLSIEQSIDVIAEKIFDIEQKIADRNALTIVDGFSISEGSTGAFSGSGNLSVETEARSVALGLVRVSCTSGDADFNLRVNGGRAIVEYPLSLQQDNDVFNVLPLKYPGNFLLTMDFDGTVNTAPFNAGIDVWVISL